MTLSRRVLPALLLCAGLLPAPPAGAADESPLSAVVGVAARVPEEARTAGVLGRHRFGSGVVVDGAGLVVTAGYLLLEATEARLVLAGEKVVPADIVAWDHRTGFGLLRAREPLAVRPMRLGADADLEPGSPALVASYGGEAAVRPGIVVARHAFAGYWEYLLDDALFVAPAHPRFAGAALIGPSGRLAGIGSLLARETGEDGTEVTSAMFLPISLLAEVLPKLLVDGRSDDPPTPWLGLYLEESAGTVRVTRVAEEGPSAAVGIAAGDAVIAVDGEAVGDLEGLYRRLWSRGAAGVDVVLSLRRDGAERSVTVTTGDRYDWLRLPPRP